MSSLPCHTVYITLNHDSRVSGPQCTAVSPPTRAKILAYRLGYAKRGIFTSLADATGKRPKLAGWQERATVQPYWIHAEANSNKEVYRDADGVLAPTGKRYRRWILDDDGGLEELEKSLGIRLRGITTEITTPSGNRQLHFLWPEDAEELRGSVGKNVQDGFEDVDVRGEGNLGLLPPSRGYGFGNSLPATHAPPELVAWSRGRIKKTRTPSVSPEDRSGTPKSPCEVVSKGSRHVSLMSTAGQLHDGRSLGDLTGALHEENATYLPPIGSPGDNDPLSDVDAIARWVYSLEPCKPSGSKNDPQHEQRISDWWYELERRGMGGKSAVRFARLLARTGLRTREATEVGDHIELPVSLAYRQAVEEIGCHRNTIYNLKERFVAKGMLRYEQPDRKNGDESGTFVLLIPTPRQDCSTPNQPSSSHGERDLVGGGTRSARPSLADLTTAHYRHRGPVGYAGEDVLCFVEAHPWLAREELAEAMGYSRPRDLERKYLRPFRDRGLLREEEGRYALAADFPELQEKAVEEPYSTVQRRGVRRWSQDEGRWVRFTVECGSVLSQRERQRRARERHRIEREQFKERRRASQGRIAEKLRECVGPALVLHDGKLVNEETGEVLPDPGLQSGSLSGEEFLSLLAPQEPAEGGTGEIPDAPPVPAPVDDPPTRSDHFPDCPCLHCLYAELAGAS